MALCPPPPSRPAMCRGAGDGGLCRRCPSPATACPARAPRSARGPHAPGPEAERCPRVDAPKRGPPQPRDAPTQPAGVQAPIGQHQDRPGPWDGPTSLAQQAPPLPAPGRLGRGRHDGPGHGHGTAPRDPAEGQDRQAGAPGRSLKGQSQRRALPRADDPGQQGLTAGLYDQRAACRPTLGRGLIAKRTPLLAPSRFCAAQPRRQERPDGRQRPGAGQDPPQAPQGQDRGLRLGSMGQVGLDERGPCGHTGVARQRYPPGGYGRDATAHTMPHRGVSCHLFDDVVPSFFKNLLQKGRPTGVSR
jgi:hypothetical protein